MYMKAGLTGTCVLVPCYDGGHVIVLCCECTTSLPKKEVILAENEHCSNHTLIQRLQAYFNIQLSFEFIE
ncbi:hypothetical protein KDA_30720 [Dictyobacter alpinus]|uniref:Uncharacterized protein n=1 Tax=Dictyobacter alpinus TaxID=2014873 RepID=A0A402B8B1_9CHLR|nr:hypothetical protein KDA_30720 [Dictyobacter alpinus]